MKKVYEGNRDPRFVRITRGGTLDDSTHQSLALWAAKCAERVLDLFEKERPDDLRPRQGIEAARAWARGEISMMVTREFTYGAASEVARACVHAVAIAHMADHELGAAFYALRAIQIVIPMALTVFLKNTFGKKKH